jgi:hypothetical protein
MRKERKTRNGWRASARPGATSSGNEVPPTRCGGFVAVGVEEIQAIVELGSSTPQRPEDDRCPETSEW